jgi:hypothetical protein
MGGPSVHPQAIPVFEAAACMRSNAVAATRDSSSAVQVSNRGQRSTRVMWADLC